MEDEDFDTSLGVGELTASETLESVLELVKILSNTTHAKHLAVDDALETHSKIIDAVWDEMPLFHSFEFLAMKLSDEEFCSDIADAAALANLTPDSEEIANGKHHRRRVGEIKGTHAGKDEHDQTRQRNVRSKQRKNHARVHHASPDVVGEIFRRRRSLGAAVGNNPLHEA